MKEDTQKYIRNFYYVICNLWILEKKSRGNIICQNYYFFR